ncbi:hypothetical protein, partial [Sediminimonas sp.]|uniref:hypothetical protein n=1 Tax=Sediminimonas sp. TaxID=2823379 RepID=UPI0025E46D8D
RCPTAGWALQRMWIALYAGQIHPRCHQLDTPAKAPARGGGRALRGGAQARLDSALGVQNERPLRPALRPLDPRSEKPTAQSIVANRLL